MPSEMFSIKSVTKILMLAVLFVLYLQLFIFSPVRAPRYCNENYLSTVSPAKEYAKLYSAPDPWQETDFDSMSPKEIVEYLNWESSEGCSFYQGKSPNSQNSPINRSKAHISCYVALVFFALRARWQSAWNCHACPGRSEIRYSLTILNQSKQQIKLLFI